MRKIPILVFFMCVEDPKLSVKSDPDPTVKLIIIHWGTVYAIS